jgi:phage terminase large subunit-like protein
MPREKPINNLGEAFKNLGSSLHKLSYAPNMNSYQPHAKQQKFHSSPKKARLYIGGNRSGKTVGGIMEDIWWATHRHPYLTLPDRPMEGRIISVDFTYGVNQIIIPKLKQWIPPSELRGGSWFSAYDSGFRVLNFENGSTIELMSYEQDIEKFAGVPRDFIHFDEEPPKPIYDECMARLVDRAGRTWLTMTPLEGMTWVYDTLYEPGQDPKNTRVQTIQVGMEENPHIDAEERKLYLDGLDDDEREARGKGNFVALGGLVYKKFSRETHVIDSLDPKKFIGSNYKIYMSLDHGFSNPTAVLWHAVDLENNVITFDEHYENERTIDYHAAVINDRNRSHGRNPDINICDPALAQRQAVTGTSIQTEYAIRGIGFALGNNDVPTGVAKVQQYLDLRADNKPSWYITENCANLIREMQRLRWKTWASKKQQANNNPHEVIHKKDDHACDSARYFFSFMPELKQTLKPPKGTARPDGFGSSGKDPNKGFIDPNLTPSALGKPKTEWRTVLNDEY